MKAITGFICLMLFLLSAAESLAQVESLAEYVGKLKKSQASGGTETAFLSIGSDFLYGQDYFEAGSYSSAAGYFQAILRKDKDHPYANFQLAVSLLKQNDPLKADLSKQYFEIAFKNNPSLKVLYNKMYRTEFEDMQSRFLAGSGTNPSLNAVAESGIPVRSPGAAQRAENTPANSTETQYGGALHYGRYTCHINVWNGPNVSPAYRSVYQGYFELKKDGTYRWLDDGPIGNYKYDPASGSITWLSGYFKGMSPRSTKYQQGSKTAQITITFSDVLRWEAGSNR